MFEALCMFENNHSSVSFRYYQIASFGERLFFEIVSTRDSALMRTLIFVLYRPDHESKDLASSVSDRGLIAFFVE